MIINKEKIKIIITLCFFIILKEFKIYFKLIK